MKKGTRKVWMGGGMFVLVTGVYLWKGDLTGWVPYLDYAKWIGGALFVALSAEHFKPSANEPPVSPP